MSLCLIIVSSIQGTILVITADEANSRLLDDEGLPCQFQMLVIFRLMPACIDSLLNSVFSKEQAVFDAIQVLIIKIHHIPWLLPGFLTRTHAVWSIVKITRLKFLFRIHAFLASTVYQIISYFTFMLTKLFDTCAYVFIICISRTAVL